MKMALLFRIKVTARKETGLRKLGAQVAERVMGL